MSKIYPIRAAGSSGWSMTHREGDTLTLLQTHYLGPRLHPRALLDQNEFATGKIFARLRQEKRNLNGKDILSVDVLVQSIPVALNVVEQERRRSGLAGLMAAFQVFRMRIWIVHVDFHELIPTVGHQGQRRVQRLASLINDFRQRIRPVFVLSAAKAVASHDNRAAKDTVLIVHGSK